MDVSLVDVVLHDGIWIPHIADGDESEFESEGEESADSEEMSGSEEKRSEEEEEVDVQVAGVGRFGALVLDDEEVDEDGSWSDEE